MGHAVHYLDATGEPRFELQASLEAALEQVEHLRNDDGVTDVRVFREVPIEVKTYYRVVVAEEAGAPASVATAPAEVTPSPEVDVASVDELDEVPELTPVAAVEDLEVPAVVAPVDAPAEPLSGAVVMSPPPVTLHPEAAELDEAEHTEPRRALFSRG